MDRTIVLDHTTAWPASRLRLETLDLPEMDDEVAAALGRAGRHYELAREVIQHTQNRDLLRLPGAGSASPPPTSPRRGRVGMSQRLALVAVGRRCRPPRPLFAQVQAQAHAFHLALRLTSPQRAAGPPPRNFFFAKPWTAANG